MGEGARRAGAVIALLKSTPEAVALRIHANGLLEGDQQTPLLLLGDFNDVPKAQTSLLLAGPIDDAPDRTSQESREQVEEDN